MKTLDKINSILLFQVYCRVCYLRAYGPGGKNKYGEANPVAMDDESAPEACVRCHSKVKSFHEINFTFTKLSVKLNLTKFFNTTRFLK